MLTSTQFQQNYFALLAESEQITGVTPDSYMFDRYDEIPGNTPPISTQQWDNLVKVASIIKSNQTRFDMTEWHTHTECGTAHCIAGWAVTLYMNDTNYDNPNNIQSIAANMLSRHVEPFFWVTALNLKLSGVNRRYYNESHKGVAEQLVMKWFIDPILEEARKESYELSSEITQFIQKAREEVAVVCHQS